MLPHPAGPGWQPEPPGGAGAAGQPEAAGRAGEAGVPPALAEALEERRELKGALLRSGLPIRFQAMVLGLATLRQVHAEEAGGAGQEEPPAGWA